MVAVGEGSGFAEEVGELSLVRVEEVSVGERYSAGFDVGRSSVVAEGLSF